MRPLLLASLVLASAASPAFAGSWFESFALHGKSAMSHAPVQLGPRPYFLVDDMSALKRTRPCPQGDEVARHVFTGVTVFQCRQMSGLGRP